MRLCTWLVLTLGMELVRRGITTEAESVGADKVGEAEVAAGLDVGLGMMFGYCLVASTMLPARRTSTRGCTEHEGHHEKRARKLRGGQAHAVAPTQREQKPNFSQCDTKSLEPTLQPS